MTRVWKSLISLMLLCSFLYEKIEGFFNVQTLLLHEENYNNVAMFTI